MLSHTKAFGSFRKLSQAHLDFVVVVCHAMPALRADLALPTPALTFAPDHFHSAQNPKSYFQTHIGNYRDELARSTLITVFSYFENYVKDALLEIAIFHGGEDKLKALALKRSAKFIATIDAAMNVNKRKLQDNPTPVKLAKYQKYARLLDEKGYRFPTELFSHFGVVQMLQKVDEKRGMRAWEIPSVMADCLLFPMTKAEHDDFEEIRSRRNKIAHGRVAAVALDKSLRYSSILHSLAARLDKHIIEHFMVIQAV